MAGCYFKYLIIVSSFALPSEAASRKTPLDIVVTLAVLGKSESGCRLHSEDDNHNDDDADDDDDERVDRHFCAA